VAATSDEERVAAQMALAALPLKTFLTEAVIPYASDEVTRLIVDRHDAAAFAPVSHLTVGDFRNWLLGEAADEAALGALAPGLTPEMVAAVSKLMRVQDLILVAKKCRVRTAFRNTLGLAGHMATRLQPNHPTDDSTGIAASIVDGLMYGSGDAVIGINPATDSVAAVETLLHLLDAVIHQYDIPTQACVLAGDFDAGAVKEANLEESKGQLRAVLTFQNVTKPWVARSGLDPLVGGALRSALLELRDAGALKTLKVSGFSTTSDAEYRAVRLSMQAAEAFDPLPSGK
jgi:ethanolamine ammonia-lyase large subunit